NCRNFSGDPESNLMLFSMTSVSLENQLHSAQKNLLFLQQDHANTLKGLHAEIRRLQQHCTDLTYELTVRSSDSTGSSELRCDELRKKCEELEAQLKAKEEENVELMKELEQKNAMISVLENTIKEREKKYLEELKTKSHKLNMLSSELEQRASTIAYLTSQLHATKKKLIATSSATVLISQKLYRLSRYLGNPGNHKHSPRSPVEMSLVAVSDPFICTSKIFRWNESKEHSVLRHSICKMTAAFLCSINSQKYHKSKERPAVIPPIASERTAASPHHSPARERQHRAHVGVAHRIHHLAPPPAPAPAEVETLAVDQVNGGKVVRKRSGTDRTV
uniref:Coiled-coil domain containing 92 n=1 Tax=Lepisosteus oculatus TaxID=7918 RepID=W5MFS2_LEPOC